MAPPLANPDAVRKKYRTAFDRGYALGSDLLSEGGVSGYCKTVEQLADGKHDIFRQREGSSGSAFPWRDDPVAIAAARKPQAPSARAARAIMVRNAAREASSAASRRVRRAISRMAGSDPQRSRHEHVMFYLCSSQRGLQR